MTIIKSSLTFSIFEIVRGLKQRMQRAAQRYLEYDHLSLGDLSGKRSLGQLTASLAIRFFKMWQSWGDRFGARGCHRGAVLGLPVDERSFRVCAGDGEMVETYCSKWANPAMIGSGAKQTSKKTSAYTGVRSCAISKDSTKDIYNAIFLVHHSTMSARVSGFAQPLHMARSTASV
jgi:hypothetical protein